MRRNDWRRVIQSRAVTFLDSNPRFCLLALAFVVSMVTAEAPAQCYYTATPIPNVGSWVCMGRAINSQGWVAGYTGDETSRALVSTPETGTRLFPMSPGITVMRATSINDLGHVAGYMTSSSAWFGFAWDGQQYSTIEVPDWATQIEVHGINNSGQLAGTLYNNQT